MMLKIRNLEAGYGRLKVLKSLSLHVKVGEIVTIIGGNGAGKSTLLHTVAGAVRTQSGSILFHDSEIANLPPERIVDAGCSLVPEGRQLFPALTVADNLHLGAYGLLRRRRKHEAAEELERVYALFPRLAERRKQLAGTLSGGEQQMVAIGRSLMAKPEFVMLDEPSMGLAPLVVRDILAVVVQLKEAGKTVLLVEQNAKAALAIADRGYVMETGHLVIEGSAAELLDNQDVQRAYLGKEYRRIDE
jgi:branched-chain amino acid transport system ATP-binding protein